MGENHEASIIGVSNSNILSISGMASPISISGSAFFSTIAANAAISSLTRKPVKMP